MREIKILADQRSAEQLSDMLMDAGCLSACIEDADRDAPDEVPLYGEPGLEPTSQAWPRSIVGILADDDLDVESALAAASLALGIEVPEITSIEEVPDADWVRITQAQFPPTQVSDRLWIVPTWHDVPNESAINLRLDPGVAFGTGSHPTTHLCLKWLDQNVKESDTVLDYGCGTGILAIAAKLLGARSALGTDIDEQAVEASRINAEQNGVEAEFVLPDAMPEGRFSIVVANILANPLQLLAPALVSRVQAGGSLVLSGVLAKQADDVVAVYRKCDPTLEISVWQTEGDWVCIAGRKTA